MSKLFDGNASDSDVEIKTDNEYATRYNNWREKEQLSKLKNKYGDNINLNQLDNESSSSEDDEDGKYLTEEFEKNFFTTLANLKRKDPKIYDDKVVFFKNTDFNKDSKDEQSKSKKHEPIFMKDYNRKLILERGGKFEDSDEEEPQEDPRSSSPTYVEEQKRIKESLKKAVDDEEGNDDDKWGGMFQKRQKTKEEEEKEEEDYMKWLKGNKEHLENEEVESELKSLKDYWNKPNLDKSEIFLRDYLLNKRYLENEDENHIPTYEEVIHDSDEGLSEDERHIEKQTEFEVKYNFRFEDPDPEFIKRYPRSMEHSVRKTDDRRKVKREEIKKRKEEEKKEKQEDLKQLKILKRKEIQEKIKKIKEITGNNEMAFNDMDIEGDFDPDEHDRRMQELFDNDFYQGVEDDQKPEFPELEEYLGPWKDQNELHCEDEDFNMDCDYDPTAAKNNKDKKGKKRNRPGKKEKNKNDIEINENDDQYGEYIDELYKLDYEDMIGDIPCRFKYRDVIPNDFGLSVEEILLAKDKELNRWCSLKKTTQFRPEQAEKYDVVAYKKKAANENLKRKYIPSLFEELEEELQETNKVKQDSNNIITFKDEEYDYIENDMINSESFVEEEKLNKNKSNNYEKTGNNDIFNSIPKEETENLEASEEQNNEKTNNNFNIDSSELKEKSKKKRKRKISESNQNENNDKPTMKKHKSSNSEEINDQNKVTEVLNKPKLTARQKKNKKILLTKMKARKELLEQGENIDNKQNEITDKKKNKFNKKKKVKNNKSDQKSKISDVRLKAYGINPKKFKNKLKYKKK